MKDKSVRMQLHIAAEHFQIFKKAQREPTSVFLYIDVRVHVYKYREQKKKYAEEKGINEKFAHTANMRVWTNFMMIF